jgi:hypothetical protein
MGFEFLTLHISSIYNVANLSFLGRLRHDCINQIILYLLNLPSYFHLKCHFYYGDLFE